MTWEECWKAGMTCKEAADYRGTDPSAAWQYAKKNGFRFKKAERGAVTSAQFAAMMDQGMAAKDIAEACNLALATVYKRAISMGRNFGSEPRREVQQRPAKPKPEAPKMPPHPFWTPARDAIVFKLGDSYAGKAEAAKRLGVSQTKVTQRWHLLRAAT